MASVISGVQLKEITFPDITGKVIRIWGQVEIDAGTYTTGGIPFGLLKFADDRTVDFNGFLRCEVWDEEVQMGGNLVTYKYSPVNDVLQIFVAGVELGNGNALPLDAVINPDAPIVNASPVVQPDHLLLFEASFDRTTVRG
jgi:hypothetical protein